MPIATATGYGRLLFPAAFAKRDLDPESLEWIPLHEELQKRGLLEKKRAIRHIGKSDVLNRYNFPHELLDKSYWRVTAVARRRRLVQAASNVRRWRQSLLPKTETDNTVKQAGATFTIVLQAEPHIDAIRNLRVALKVLKRRYGLRVVTIRQS